LPAFLALFGTAGALLTAGIWWLFYRPGSWPFDTVGYVIGRDFVNYWLGAQLFADGKIAELFNFPLYQTELWTRLGVPLAERPQPERIAYIWSYPPHLGILLRPLAFLDYFPALIAWLAATFAVYAAASLAAVRADMRGAVLVLLLLAPSTHLTLYAGQNGFLTGALLIGALVLLYRYDRPVLAGVLLGLLTIKPQLGLFVSIMLLVERKWSTIAAAAATTIALVGLSLALDGLAPWQGYLDFTMPSVRRILTEFSGFQTGMMLSVFASLRLTGLPHEVAISIQAIVSVAVLASGAVAIAWARDLADRLMLVALGSFLVTPYAFNYDLPLLTTALAVAITTRPPMRGVEGWLAGILFVLPVALYPLQFALTGLGILPVASAYLLLVQRLRAENRSGLSRLPATVAHTG